MGSIVFSIYSTELDDKEATTRSFFFLFSFIESTALIIALGDRTGCNNTLDVFGDQSNVKREGETPSAFMREKREMQISIY